MRQIIGLSATRNSHSLKFGLQLSTDSPHTCRMSWSTIKSTVDPWPMNIVVTSYPQSRLKTKVKVQQPRSRRLPLIYQPLYLTSTIPPGFQFRRIQGIVSWAPTRDPRKRLIRTMVPSATVSFAISQEFLSGIIYQIVPRTVRACVPTGPSRMEWEDLLGSTDDTVKQHKKSEKMEERAESS